MYPAGAYLGIAISGMLNMIEPGSAMIKDTLTVAHDLLLAPLGAAMRRRHQGTAVKQVAIILGAFSDDAIALVVEHAFNTPLLVYLPDAGGAFVANHTISPQP